MSKGDLEIVKDLYANKKIYIEKIKEDPRLYITFKTPDMIFCEEFNNIYKLLTKDEKEEFKIWQVLQDKIIEGKVELY